jgi:predicted dehydrogenase
VALHRGRRSAGSLAACPDFSDYYDALSSTRPDVVSINTYPETHAPYASAALKAGCHVFCEKPLAETVEEAQSIVDMAHANRRKLVIGYILRVHPAWVKFIEIARTLGKPLVMRMNLNQQSHGNMWNVHRNLMKSMSPIVDCGVHYVDVMCQMDGSKADEGLRDWGADERRAQAGDVQLRPAAGHLR